MSDASEKTMILARAGLVNDPSICIKNFGATIACSCEDCREEFRREMLKWGEPVNPSK